VNTSPLSFSSFAAANGRGVCCEPLGQLSRAAERDVVAAVDLVGLKVEALERGTPGVLALR